MSRSVSFDSACVVTVAPTTSLPSAGSVYSSPTAGNEAASAISKMMDRITEWTTLSVAGFRINSVSAPNPR